MSAVGEGALRDAHRYFLEIDEGRIWRVRVDCPFDHHDDHRPCWPHDESGTVKLPAPQDCCTYVDWSENLAPDEMLYGELSIEVDCKPDWSNGEGLELHLLGVASDRPAHIEGETR